MTRRSRGSCLVPACLVAASLAIANLACDRGADPARSRGSTVTVAYCCATTVLNPSEDMEAKFLVFLPLLALGENGELEGRLARRWEHSPDYAEWTYHLRTEVHWHDGAPVTAHDVKFTLDLLAGRDLLYGPLGFESVTVFDDSTVTIRSREPGPHQTWIVYYPKHLLEQLDPKHAYEWDFWSRPVGNGPYRFVRYLPETMMEFEANPDYYRGKPRIDRVVLKFAGQAGLGELLSGNVDAVSDINPDEVSKLAGDPRFRVYYFVDDVVAWAIYWHGAHPLFRDPRVRRALTLAINRRDLLRLRNLPESMPIFDGPFTPRQLRRGNLPEPLPYDPAAAEALLDSAGWRDQDGVGVREREAKEFRFTAIVPGYAGQGLDKVAVYVQDQLRRVGVRMDIQQVGDFPVLWERVKAGKFEAALGIVVFNPDWLQEFFRADSPLGLTDPQVIALLNRAMASGEPDLQDEVFSRLTDFFRAEVPVTILTPFTRTTVAHRRLHGLSTSGRADPVRYMEELWVEDASR